MNLNVLPDNITVHDPTIVPMDVALEKAFEQFEMARLGGASGRGWSSYQKLMACPRQFQLRYIIKVVSEERAALGLGSCWHTFIALYYLNMKALMAGDEEGPAPSQMRDALLEIGADAVLISEAWRLFEYYADHWEGVGDYLEPLAIEHYVQDPRTRRTARYDLIARVTDDGKARGIIPGVYVIEHKCLESNSILVDAATGRQWTIGELSARRHAPTVLVIDDGQLRAVPACVPTPNRVRDIYHVALTSGRFLDASDNHPFLTARGWVPAAELTSADWVAVPCSTGNSSIGAASFSDDEVAFLGYMIGDGSMVDAISYSKTAPACHNRFVDRLCRLGYQEGGGTPTSYRLDLGTPTHAPSVYISKAVESPLRQLLERVELYGKYSVDKTLHRDLMSLPDAQTARLLGGLWDTDGCIDVFEEVRDDKPAQQKIRIAYVSRSEQLCQQIQSLLLRFGLVSTVCRSTVKYEGERRPYWTVKIVTRGGKRRFLNAVLEGRISVPKYAVRFVREARDAVKPGDDRLIPVDRFRDKPMTGIQRNHLVGPRRSVMVDSIRTAGVAWADEVINEAIYWDRVDSVIVTGRAMTYDIEVPGAHNFVANDIITHNTSSSWGEKTANSFHLDGEVVGQLALWRKARPTMTRKFGKLQGVIINVVTKGKVPRCHREIVATPNKVVSAQWHDLDFWEANEAFYRAAGHWPKSLAACWGRYGPCDYVERCKTK